MFPPAVKAGAPEWVIFFGQTLWVIIIAYFIIDEVIGRFLGFTLREPGSQFDDGLGNLYSMLSFAIGIANTFAVQALLNALRRRETILFLLGAQVTCLGGIGLLLCGIVAAIKIPTIIQWLFSISPPPKLCSLVLYFRRYGIFIGYGVPSVYLGLLLIADYFPGFDAMQQMLAASLLGGVAGAAVMGLLVNEWWENRDALEKEYRVVMLFPGTKDVAQKNAMRTLKVQAGATGQKILKKTAENTASAIFKGVVKYCTSSSAAASTALKEL
eukprot:gnl/MRDRNA2_/MRDRNA2_315110_c0_seq1.p1 gnl/MRDRNA2_/MRDRNA2_315110_c0~~gnl/MRDRNA2_/MRDRNA2_315110_c0_seq1.p1  ORF type:complete len:299 (-),score=49.10 gnl/MRDRNA2_/MRDRNA2_315110_c0_seq1:43-852(-)